MTPWILPSLLAALVVVTGLAGCQSDPDWEYIEADSRRQRYDPNYGQSIFGGDGLQLFGGGGDAGETGSGGGIGVNTFLWRASLDTISFMPLASADPFGGVIITDWYAPPESPHERFKLTVYILDRTLRADGLRVAVFKQERLDNGDWRDASISGTTVTSLENRILERARELRTASITG